ncbi:MAG: hypothetical protein WBF13_06765, partial [Candidatus Zixiibacteriota bacterium]
MLRKDKESISNRCIFLMLAIFVSLFSSSTTANGQGIDSSSIIPPNPDSICTAGDDPITLPNTGRVKITIIFTETSSLKDILGLRPPYQRVFTTNARNCVGCSWIEPEEGHPPFNAGTVLEFYLDNEDPHTGPRQVTMEPLISGGPPLWTLGFDDWYDMDYNDVVCEVEFFPELCEIDMAR